MTNPFRTVEGNTKVATKGGKSVAAKKGKTTPAKPAKTVKPAPPAAKTPSRPAKSAAKETKPAGAVKATAPSRGAVTLPPVVRPAHRPVEPSLLERAERLRDAIQTSKLTAPDPWPYAGKARGWTQRAQALVEDVARRGDTRATRRAIDTLTAEVEGDRDYQEALRRT